MSEGTFSLTEAREFHLYLFVFFVDVLNKQKIPYTYCLTSRQPFGNANSIYVCETINRIKIPLIRDMKKKNLNEKKKSRLRERANRFM